MLLWHLYTNKKRLTKKALLSLRSPSKPAALLWGTKVPVVANIARTQWHLRSVNCAFSGFASLKIALFIQSQSKASNPILLLSRSLFVVLPGFEPGQTEPKPVVLPLHHRTILICSLLKSSAKLVQFVVKAKFFPLILCGVGGGTCL